MIREKICTADLDSPRQELSSGGLRIVVALSVFPAIDLLSARIGRPIQLYFYCHGVYVFTAAPNKYTYIVRPE